jgi:hypothetical protein
MISGTDIVKMSESGVEQEEKKKAIGEEKMPWATFLSAREGLGTKGVRSAY